MLWSAFHPLVTHEVIDAPLPLVDAVLRRVAAQFCTDTQVWADNITPVNVVSGTGTYTLAVADAQAEVCAVSQLWYDGALLKFIPLAQMRRYSTHWPSDSGAVEGFTQHDEATVTLYKTPIVSITAGLKGRVILRPALASTGVPDWIGAKYHDTLVNGAKARLMGMVTAPWANERGASVYSSLYKGDSMAVAIARASVTARGPSSAPGDGAQE